MHASTCTCTFDYITLRIFVINTCVLVDLIKMLIVKLFNWVKHGQDLCCGLCCITVEDEYEKNLKRATDCCRKSQFPSKECWKPPFEVERELLLGPHPEIVMYKKKVIIHEKTKRKIVYITLLSMNMHNPGTSVHMFKFIVLQNHQYPCLDKLDDCLHTTLLELHMN